MNCVPPFHAQRNAVERVAIILGGAGAVLRLRNIPYVT